MYDIFGELEIQIKAGECLHTVYKIGDKVDFEDGIYMGFCSVGTDDMKEGAIVVKEGVFIAEFDCVKDPFGHYNIEPL